MPLAAVTHEDRRQSDRAEGQPTARQGRCRLGTKGAIVTISTMLTANSNKGTKNHENNEHIYNRKHSHLRSNKSRPNKAQPAR